MRILITIRRLLIGVLAFQIISSAFAGAPSRAVCAQAEPQDGVALPVIMYHSIIKEPRRWGAYVISPDEFESDLKYIRDNGYTTVTVQDLIDYVYDGKQLPEKPIMLTFDDGYYNNYLYAFPLLQKYNMKAVLSIIGKYSEQYSLTAGDNPYFSHVTWAQINEMVDSGLVEIQNHSYDMHTINKNRTAGMKNNGESDEHYRTVLISDTVRLQSLVDNYTGHMPTAFAYPFGLVSKESIDILKEIGFKSSFSCYSGVNRITKDPDCLYLLKRNLRAHGKSVNTILTHWQQQ